jgi:hypothetical protein
MNAMPTGAGSGEFVTETFEFDGGRQVTVYVPPDPPEKMRDRRKTPNEQKQQRKWVTEMRWPDGT